MTPELAEGLTTGTAVRLFGGWQLSPPGKEQPVELDVQEVEILGENDAAPASKEISDSTIPANDSPSSISIASERSSTSAATHTPVLTSSDCEGAGEVFTVSSNASTSSDQKPVAGKAAAVDHFFKDPKYLTVSAQLHLEALAQSVGNVWTLSPTFRAEKSDTPRHLSEFYMLEAEVAFEDDMHRIMDVVENMLRSAAQSLRRTRTVEELLQIARNKERDSETEDGQETVITAEALEQRWVGLSEKAWPRITYEQAIEALQLAEQTSGVQFEHEATYETGFQAEHERYLAKNLGRGGPIFVTHYPRHQKPFYMTPSITNGKETVECFDLLVPDLCELAGGSMREHRSKELKEAMRSRGLLKNTGEQTDADDISNMQWYIDLRKYGSVPHGGFGLGFDRLLCYLSGVSNIRDVVAFPRWYGRCDA
ncbi:hypothetical protein MBLNU457_g3039t2 [Dothideomycetes sp. NU457]